MKIFQSINDDQVAVILKGGGVGVIRTDTIYGIVGVSSNAAAVQRIYDSKGRSAAKPLIVLIGSPEQMFDPVPDYAADLFGKVWPGKTSIILPTINAPSWIDRDTKTVAYRQPDNDDLIRLLLKTGPLSAPSANPEGMPPACSIEEAIAYFGEAVDFYVDSGVVSDNTPSRLIKISDDGSMEQLR